MVNALERDPQLVQAEGPHQGKLAFPWGHGVVFTRITRKQFDAAGLGEAIEPHRVICSGRDDGGGGRRRVPAAAVGHVPARVRQRCRCRSSTACAGSCFPKCACETQGALFDDSDAEADLPDIMRVMDLQQEQLARSLGDGHRVIHGVAGSGKTMILGYRAEHLAKAARRQQADPRALLQRAAGGEARDA